MNLHYKKQPKQPHYLCDKMTGFMNGGQWMLFTLALARFLTLCLHQHPCIQAMMLESRYINYQMMKICLDDQAQRTVICCGDPIAAFQYLKRGCQTDGARHITKVCRRRTGDDSHKQTEDVMIWIKGKQIKVKIIKHWNRLPREAMESPSLENWKKKT